jgi:integrase
MFSYFFVRGITALADLSTKRSRDRLKGQRDPHFMKLGKGAFLGFRVGPDNWHARFRDRKGVQHYKALDGIGSTDYEGAKKAAEAWFHQMGGSTIRTVKRATVRLALEAYLADLKRQGRAEAAKETLGRYKLTIYADSIADEALEAIGRDDFEEFRDRLTKGRKARSVNRQYRAIAAGLNRAIELGHIGNPAAWRLKPLSDDIEDDGETAVFLNAAQRKTIIAEATVAAGAFFRGLELTGARPKELAAAVAGDFDGKALRLAHRKGRPAKLRVRYTVLGIEGIEYFKKLAADKLPKAPLFTEDGSQTWRRHIWAREFRVSADKVNKEAKGAARIPGGAGAYSFRHARISELLQIHSVDPLTVAMQTGTSLAMIEKAYMRFIPQALQEKLMAVKS